jgi:hypothetical protein
MSGGPWAVTGPFYRGYATAGAEVGLPLYRRQRLLKVGR